MSQKFYEELKHIIPEARIKADEPMKAHTTFRIGGPAKYFVIPETKEEIKAIIECCKAENVPYYILGNGSNLLVGDQGFRGVVIQLYKNFDGIKIEGTKVTARAGAMLVRVAKEAGKAGLTGLEFASGIPGTIGGAMVMNAGAYGGEISQVIKSATVMDKNGNIREVKAADMALGYRTSVFKESEDIILSVQLKLVPDDKDLIRERMEDYFSRRREKQPLEFPSAGSTFKRPDGYFAAALIEECGLKGVSVGGAQVSEKHSGFVINTGNATASDVLELIEHIKQTVFMQKGVTLECEIKVI